MILKNFKAILGGKRQGEREETRRKCIASLEQTEARK